MKTAFALMIISVATAQLLAGDEPEVSTPTENAAAAVVESESPPETASAVVKELAQDPRLTEEQGKKKERVMPFTEARERMPLEKHDRAWWDAHFESIVFAGSGYYYLDGGYWYPAYGYDPDFDTYPFNGPIYAFGELSPDREIAAVQEALQANRYYGGAISSELDEATLAALTNFQTDKDLLATGAIDEPTVEALRLASSANQ